jgi:hypothetical protein
MVSHLKGKKAPSKQTVPFVDKVALNMSGSTLLSSAYVRLTYIVISTNNQWHDWHLKSLVGHEVVYVSQYIFLMVLALKGCNQGKV